MTGHSNNVWLSYEFTAMCLSYRKRESTFLASDKLVAFACIHFPHYAAHSVYFGST
jgi:hypothetical protein